MTDRLPPVFEKSVERIDSERVRERTFFESAQVMETKRDRKVHFAQFGQRVGEEAEEVREQQNASWQGRSDGWGREVESESHKIA